MFDKMILTGQCEAARDGPALAAAHHLVHCTEAGREYWQSSALGNLDGYFMQLKGGHIQVKFSLHKLYSKFRTGMLDNSGTFRMSDAIDTMGRLYDLWELDRFGHLRVTYYEIGLNLPVSRDPLEYISLARSVGTGRNREMFNDANFEKNRQKTTEKSRNIKKVFKLYDKGFEARSKRRDCEGNILRVETVYRRQSVGLDELLSSPCMEKIQHIFLRDWANAEFDRRLVADKGVKASQIEKASLMLRLGREEYMARARTDLAEGYISEKQYRTTREFAASWDTFKEKIRAVPLPHETEYKELIIKTFAAAKS